MKQRRILLMGATVLLCMSCGRVAPLRPAAGQPLPVKPLMARATPTPQQLLTPPIYAKPDRVDELIRRSEARRADPFDLPPPTGGAAPTLPAAIDPGNTSDEEGPVPPP